MLTLNNSQLKKRFADIEQVISNFATLNKSKPLIAKLPLEKPDTYAFVFFRPLPHVTGTPPWLLRSIGSPPALSSTPTLGFFCFFECMGIQFFNSLTCDLPDAMPSQRSLTLTHMWLMGHHATPEVTCTHTHTHT